MSVPRPAAPFSCFVTGTDTGVGKTMVASALVHLQGKAGWRAAGMKPVAAGTDVVPGAEAPPAWRNEDVEQLALAGAAGLARAELCVYALERALAPHIAAALEGVRIEPEAIVQACERLRARVDAVVVEGVGGFRVPLASGFDTADLAVRLQLPVVLVVGLRLGCLNHALLTAEAIAARGLALAGWVGNRIDPAMQEVERNIETLETLLSGPLLGVIPPLASPTASEAAAYLSGSFASAGATLETPSPACGRGRG